MIAINVEVLLDFKNDVCEILILRKDTRGNLQIIDRYSNCRLPISHYLEKLYEWKNRFHYDIVNLPPEAYFNTFHSDITIVEILKSNGFKVYDKSSTN